MSHERQETAECADRRNFIGEGVAAHANVRFVPLPDVQRNAVMGSNSRKAAGPIVSDLIPKAAK